MNEWVRRWMVVLGLCLLPTASLAGAAGEPEAVPAEDYPLMDEVVSSKFLSSQTRVVVMERSTTTRLNPEDERLPSLALFEEGGFFEFRLPPDLVRNFIFNNQRPYKLESRFAFGVRYRFVSGDGSEELETRRLGPDTGLYPVQNVEPSDSVDRLIFSRVGRTVKGDQALVYVANLRPDSTGAGFLFWLRWGNGKWWVFDSDVVWVARPNRGTLESP
ncbi:MAG: hypothetical protein KF814_04580 [Nitrospiraceae bacterium]|nr:hypothetical protein [Nitrospiraceae bacterium]